MILRNQKGTAILMIMGSIALLSFLFAEFTFETQVNRDPGLQCPR